MSMFDSVSKRIDEDRQRVEELELKNRERVDKYITNMSEQLSRSIKASLAYNLKNKNAVTYNVDLSKIVQVDRTVTLEEYEDLVTENEKFENFIDDLEDNDFECTLKFEKRAYKLSLTIEKG